MISGNIGGTSTRGGPEHPTNVLTVRDARCGAQIVPRSEWQFGRVGGEVPKWRKGGCGSVRAIGRAVRGVWWCG
jgi:hypothetical protein